MIDVDDHGHGWRVDFQSVPHHFSLECVRADPLSLEAERLRVDLCSRQPVGLEQIFDPSVYTSSPSTIAREDRQQLLAEWVTHGELGCVSDDPCTKSSHGENLYWTRPIETLFGTVRT